MRWAVAVVLGTGLLSVGRAQSGATRTVPTITGLVPMAVTAGGKTKLRVLGLKVGKPPLISWLKRADDDELAPIEMAEEGAVKADADDAVRAQRSAARLELPIFIFECDNY